MSGGCGRRKDAGVAEREALYCTVHGYKPALGRIAAEMRVERDDKARGSKTEALWREDAVVCRGDNETEGLLLDLVDIRWKHWALVERPTDLAPIGKLAMKRHRAIRRCSG